MEKFCVFSDSMRAIHTQALEIAKSNLTVLLTGETGTGKNQIAELIHRHSPRASYPYRQCNVAALPKDLIESELFGSVRGAFTGARNRVGAIRSADGGTLLLDEIGDLPYESQSKLLHTVENGAVQKLGSDEESPVNVRFICATKMDLLEAVRAKLFRDDLYYRLHVEHLHLPPLRERQEEICPLAEHFLTKWRITLHKKLELSEAACRLLSHYPFPGNIRELENAVLRAAHKCDDVIEAKAFSGLGLPSEVWGTSLMPMHKWLRKQKRDYIKRALDEYQGNRRAAAKVLRVSVSSVYRLAQ